MKKELQVVPSAQEINNAYAFSKESAEMAVDWAVKCGQMLTAKKDEIGHGGWEDWVKDNCEFSERVARKYMQVAKEAAKQNGMLMPFSTMDKLLGYEKPKPKPKELPQGAVPVVNPKGTGETGIDRPAAPISSSVIEADPDEPERPEWEPDEDLALELAERDYQERIDKAMAGDDALAEAFAQIKQQSALIATLTLARDSYMNSQGEAVRQLKKERNKVARLEKELDQLRKRAA